jgi:hypothetical protein
MWEASLFILLAKGLSRMGCHSYKPTFITYFEGLLFILSAMSFVGTDCFPTHSIHYIPYEVLRIKLIGRGLFVFILPTGFALTDLISDWDYPPWVNTCVPSSYKHLGLNRIKT